MICCKIIANYKQVCLEFANIFKDLTQLGDVLWDNNYFYFANTSDVKINDKNIRKVFKKHNCSDIFIERYDKDYQPQENDNVNHWVEDKLIKIGYNEFEINGQQEMQSISKELRDLNNMLEQLKQSQSQTEETKEENL